MILYFLFSRFSWDSPDLGAIEGMLSQFHHKVQVWLSVLCKKFPINAGLRACFIALLSAFAQPCPDSGAAIDFKTAEAMKNQHQNTDWQKVSEIELIYKTKIKSADRPYISSSRDVYRLLDRQLGFS